MVIGLLFTAFGRKRRNGRFVGRQINLELCATSHICCTKHNKIIHTYTYIVLTHNKYVHWVVVHIICKRSYCKSTITCNLDACTYQYYFIADMIPSRKFTLYSANILASDNRNSTHYGATYFQKDTLKPTYCLNAVVCCK